MVPEKRENLCRTLLSSTVLNYPPPTLIGYQIGDKGNELRRVSARGNIQIANNFLRTGFRVHELDLVLVVSGDNAAFQLPPEILVKRYHDSVKRANEELGKKYGFLKEAVPWDLRSKGTKSVSRFRQTVLVTMPDNCSEDPEVDILICQSNNGVDLLGSVHAGSMIGPVKDVRAIYERATQGLTTKGKGPSQIFLDILNEQRRFRGLAYEQSRRMLGKWSWQMPIDSQAEHEVSLGLDENFTVFHAMSHFDPLVKQKGKEGLANDISLLRLPYPGTSPSDITYQARSFLPLHSSALDLPFLKNGSLNPPLENTWSSTSLLTSPSTGESPVVILSHHPQEQWYATHARSLLRETIRRPQPPIYLPPSLPQNLTWDYRGGGSGYWTTTQNWLSFKDVCEDEDVGNQVFGDGKGAWGKEDGWENRERLWNFWGKRVIGEEVI